MPARKKPSTVYPDNRDLLIAAGIDPDTPTTNLDTLNMAYRASSDRPEAYQPQNASGRDLAPVSFAYAQDRTPWTPADRDLVY